MKINAPEIKRQVTDYDITLDSGFLLSLTIDHEKGDTFSEADGRTVAYLSAKPSKINQKEIMPAEEITVFTSHILVMSKKDRTVIELDPEDQQNWLDAFEEAGKTVQ